MASESTPIIEIRTIDILREAYPGQAVLTTDQIANALAKTGKAGAQTIRNQIAAGTFPLSGKIKKVGGRNVLPMAAFADWLDGAEEAPSPKAPEKRRRGRPRKIVMEWLAELEEAWQGLLEAGRKDLDADPGVRAGSGEKGSAWI